ncbi:MAG TPA: anthranilate phosphoribosyltransferase [Gemmatimonadales bacterium]|nr:anthranilate phosphoribosyltransferase [Gemmatimonadales bacterium]
MADAPSPIQQALTTLAEGASLPETLAADVFGAIMRGEASAVQTAALLMGLRAKGETPIEVAGAVRALRDAMLKVDAGGIAGPLIDTCGTGGGRIPTFNVSTAAAFVAVGAGAVVAKHGNRSFTSKCGSADVLEALGIRITHDPASARAALGEARMVFLFAPNFHPAMRHVTPVRRELGVASVMNLVGPLANPAGARRQVVGVADPGRAELMAGALARLGTEHALVVHGMIGMDEVAPAGETKVWEVRGAEVKTWSIDPAAHGLAVADPRTLAGGEPAENAKRLERVLSGGRSEQDGLAAVLLNAGAAVYVAGLASSYKEGIARAKAAVESGAARAALETLRRVSPSTSG